MKTYSYVLSSITTGWTASLPKFENYNPITLIMRQMCLNLRKCTIEESKVVMMCWWDSITSSVNPCPEEIFPFNILGKLQFILYFIKKKKLNPGTDSYILLVLLLVKLLCVRFHNLIVFFFYFTESSCCLCSHWSEVFTPQGSRF